ncbi:MAG: 3-hydroxybutyryl-CoA dehydrogenase [Myxococcales bacterium]|nr:3-hydroxybutyryl-CoA dehydrogenase [Myxococcales bacterium]MCB9538827.1 3-hydroxybutyryl-CoA dehydrogenase [Myxococcales bacterium]
MSDIEVIGVVGAGQMGAGIAHVAALSGFKVLLADADRARAEKGKAGVQKRMARAVEKGKLEASAMEAALEAITPVDGLGGFRPAQFVIEAVNENEALKTSIFETLDGVLAADALRATNTSSIPITRIAAKTKHPERFIGMHFMNPVPVMELVEVITGLQTAPETLKTTQALAAKMGKTTIIARDMPGFAINRILMPMINEAVYALYEGIASAEDIDTGMKLGTNQPMGPLTLADFIGLDTCLAIMEVLHAGLGDTKYRPCPLLRQYVEAGWLGRKSGRGFHTY